MYGCSRPNCNNPHRSNGLCKTHYDADYYNQTDELNQCSKPTCTKRHRSRGLCSNHYKKMMKNKPSTDKSVSGR